MRSTQRRLPLASPIPFAASLLVALAVQPLTAQPQLSPTPAASPIPSPAPTPAPPPHPGTMPAVLAASTPADWAPLDPENTLYVELATGRVVIALAPAF